MSTQTQTTDFYQFSLSEFNCIAVSDGTYDYDPRHLILDISEEDLQLLLLENDLPTDKITSPYTFLYVDTGFNKILVDMGAGKLGPNTGKLIANLAKANVRPEDVDTVVITHAHPDHIGGTLNEEGKPNFPNARYFMWKVEWDFWFSDEAVAEVDRHLAHVAPTELFMKFARGQLGPIEEKITFIERESEILPGVFVHFAPGHTPGHMVVSFESHSDKLFFTSDTVIFPFFLSRPELKLSLDIDQEEADKSKRRIFDLVSEHNALVLGQHFMPFPSLGYVHKQPVGWDWVPIKTFESHTI